MLVVCVGIPVGVPEARTTSISQVVPVPLGFSQFKVAPSTVIAEKVSPVGGKHCALIPTLSINHRSPSIAVVSCVYTFTNETYTN